MPAVLWGLDGRPGPAPHEGGQWTKRGRRVTTRTKEGWTGYGGESAFALRTPVACDRPRRHHC